MAKYTFESIMYGEKYKDNNLSIKRARSYQAVVPCSFLFSCRFYIYIRVYIAVDRTMFFFKLFDVFTNQN